MKIYIVRHGETNSNKRGRLQGWLNDPLNNFGRELARGAGKGLKKEGIQFDAVFSSPLDRAHETAELILAELGSDQEIVNDERIKEICVGDFEGKLHRPGECEVDEEVIGEFFRNPRREWRAPGGESIQEVMDRTQDFLKELATKDYESVLVATHGCALRCMLNLLYEDKTEFWHGHVPYNCCINIVEVTKPGEGQDEATNTDAEPELKLVGDDVIYYDKSLIADRFAKHQS